MSYLTVEVEIDHGRIQAKGGDVLPEKASGLLTLLPPQLQTQPRPIGLAKGQLTVPEGFNAPLPEDVLQAFESLQKYLSLDANKAAKWMASGREAKG